MSDSLWLYPDVKKVIQRIELECGSHNRKETNGWPRRESAVPVEIYLDPGTMKIIEIAEDRFSTWRRVDKLPIRHWEYSAGYAYEVPIIFKINTGRIAGSLLKWEFMNKDKSVVKLHNPFTLLAVMSRAGNYEQIMRSDEPIIFSRGSKKSFKRKYGRT